MTPNFIKLTHEFGDTIFINPIFIVTILDYGSDKITRINFTGHSVCVKESALEIAKRITDSNL